jgi:hypothetical protein
MPMTLYERDRALQFDFTAAALTRASAWYAGLFTAFPGDAGGSSFSNEFTSGADTSYARQSVTLALSSHILSNTGAVVWTAGGTWAAATFLGVFDASTTGNLLAYQEMSQSGASFFLAAVNVANPGSAYAASDTITLTGGAVVTVTAVATVNSVAGVIQSYRVTTPGSYASIATGPISQTGTSGSGTGATWLGSFLAAPQSFQLNNADTFTFAIGAMNLTMS